MTGLSVRAVKIVETVWVCLTHWREMEGLGVGLGEAC